MPRKRHSTRLKHRPKDPFAVGVRGIIRFGNSEVGVEIVEDRGPLGDGGRRLLRVRRTSEDAEPDTTFEVGADDLVLNR